MTVDELRATLEGMPGDMPVFSTAGFGWPTPIRLVGQVAMYRDSRFEGTGESNAGTGYRVAESFDEDKEQFDAIALGCYKHDVRTRDK